MQCLICYLLLFTWLKFLTKMSECIRQYICNHQTESRFRCCIWTAWPLAFISGVVEQNRTIITEATVRWFLNLLSGWGGGTPSTGFLTTRQFPFNCTVPVTVAYKKNWENDDQNSKYSQVTISRRRINQRNRARNRGQRATWRRLGDLLGYVGYMFRYFGRCYAYTCSLRRTMPYIQYIT